MYNEVKRKAAVGERIKIVNAGFSGMIPAYKNGDVVVVTEQYGDMGVRIDRKWKDGSGVNAWVAHKEYVVLEPVESAKKALPDGLTESFAQFLRDNAATVRKFLDQIEDKAESAVQTATKTLTRAQVIDKARKDVAELTAAINEGRGADCGVVGDNGARSLLAVAHVNREKRTVTVLLRGKYSGRVWTKAIAKCAPGDVFHAEIGKAIALRKALGLAVPAEYTNAPQPDKKRAGAVVTCEGKTFKLWSSEKVYLPGEGEAHIGSYYGKNGVIIDDTDVDYTKEAA